MMHQAKKQKKKAIIYIYQWLYIAIVDYYDSYIILKKAKRVFVVKEEWLLRESYDLLSARAFLLPLFYSISSDHLLYMSCILYIFMVVARYSIIHS